jgi:outer membrane lipoprotein-sorting protein
MNRKPRYIFSLLILQLLISVSLLTSSTFAQAVTPKEAKPDDVEKAEDVIKRAIAAMGGNSYLNVHSVSGRGQFTQFREGMSGLPSAFVDYIIFPDRERTEFKNPEGRIVQTNTGETGWIFDGASKSIKDMSKAQVEDFKMSLRTSVDNLLRGPWRKEGAKLSYAGRREAGLAKRNEVVRLTYSDDYMVEFEFGAKDSLPMKVLYKRMAADGTETAEEDRLAQHLNIQGVIFPFVVDHYSAGVQTSRINYQSVEFNQAVPDSLFAKPANVKAVK